MYKDFVFQILTQAWQVGGLDRSWQRPPGVAAKLIDSKSANGTGTFIFFFVYSKTINAQLHIRIIIKTLPFVSITHLLTLISPYKYQPFFHVNKFMPNSHIWHVISTLGQFLFHQMKS